MTESPDCARGRAQRQVPLGLFDGRPLTGARLVGALVWLAFLLFPLIDAIDRHGSAAHHGFVIGAAALFVAAYVALVLTWRSRRQTALTTGLFAVLVAVAIALTLVDQSNWGFLFTYACACASLLSSSRLAFSAVAMCTVLAGVTSSLSGASGGSVVGFVASTAGIGLLMLLMRDLRVRNEELSRARAELARLAVTEERERFARDLHDLLGHSLSVIALKAELAGRLLPSSPERAASEIAEAETVARQALTEVREAVSGYRRPTLIGELEGARMALSAAGIAAELQRPAVALDSDVEAVLAWAVREGATNAIRHSGARNVAIRVSAGLADAAVEVIDDGVGGTGSAANGDGGHGLRGLAERAERLDGRLEAGARPEGGFRLAVIVPARLGAPAGSAT